MKVGAVNMDMKVTWRKGQVNLVLATDDGEMRCEMAPEVAIGLANALHEAGGASWTAAFAVARVPCEEEKP